MDEIECQEVKQRFAFHSNLDFAEFSKRAHGHIGCNSLKLLKDSEQTASRVLANSTNQLLFLKLLD